MRSYNIKKRNNIILGALALVLITMAGGYAIFSSNLNITGTSNISNNWDIRISKVAGTLSGHAAHATDSNENEINPECDSTTSTPKSCGEGLTVTFSDLFYYEGDSSTYNITLKNSGSLDATLTQNVEPVITTNSDKIKVELTGFKTKGQILAKNDTQTTTLTITYAGDTALADTNNKIKPLSNTKTITPRLLDNEEEEQPEASITITYPFVQDSESGAVTSEKHLVEYDCTTNGGTSCTNYKEYVTTGQAVNLENEGINKYDLAFLGWNTDKDAEEGLSTLTMGNNDIKLYAIYQKDKITFNSVTTTSTTNSITVVASAQALSEITKYEYSTDGEHYYEGSIDTTNNNSTYTFTGLNHNTSYPIYVKATTKSGASDIYEIRLVSLTENTVTEGDGLYPDSTENGRYIYRGANPDNYICLGDLSNERCPEDSLYRIISIESDGSLKVIRNTSIGSIVWDPGYSTTLTYNNSITITSSSNVSGTRRQGASASQYFCRDFISTGSSTYYGCKSWGSATTTLNSSGTTTSTMPHTVGGTALTLPTYNSWLNTYLNGGTYHAEASTTSVTGWIDGNDTGLNNTAKSKVLSTKTFNIGPISSDSSYTLAQNKSQEATYKWKGKVGLMNITDYVAASTNTACTNLYSYTNTADCYNNSNTHNWLFLGSNEWTISPYSNSYALDVWGVGSSGTTSHGSAYNTRSARPVLYLSSTTEISGKGNFVEPYAVGKIANTKSLQTPTFNEKYKYKGKTITIDYHKECGSNGITCTYIKDGVTTSNLTGSTQTVEYTDDGTLVAIINDGINTVTTSSYTVTMPTGTDYFIDLEQTDSTLITDDYGNIRYSGKNVNNYVCMDSSEATCSEANLYRIIGVFNNIKTTEEGAGETRIKLIKATNNGDDYWNASVANGGTSTNNWTEASLKNTLNSSSFAQYSNSLIDDTVWNIGGYNSTEVTTKNMYYYERSKNTNKNNVAPSTWTGKVALMYPSDYGYASSVCKDGSKKLSEYGNSTCKDSNWLYQTSITNEWLLSPSSANTDYAFFANGGNVANYSYNVNHVYAVYSEPLAVRPAFYLKSSVNIIVNEDHEGSSNKPYLIE